MSLSLKLDLAKLIVDDPVDESALKSLSPREASPSSPKLESARSNVGSVPEPIQPQKPPQGSLASTSANTSPRKRHVIEPKQFAMTDVLPEDLDKEYMSKNWKIDTGKEEDKQASVSRRLIGKTPLRVTAPRARKDPSRGAENNHRQPTKQLTAGKDNGADTNTKVIDAVDLSVDDSEDEEEPGRLGTKEKKAGSFEKFEVELKSTFGETGVPTSANAVIHSNKGSSKTQKKRIFGPSPSLTPSVGSKNKTLLEDQLAVTSYNHNVSAFGRGKQGEETKEDEQHTQEEQEKEREKEKEREMQIAAAIETPLNKNLLIFKLDTGEGDVSSEYNCDLNVEALDLGVTSVHPTNPTNANNTNNSNTNNANNTNTNNNNANTAKKSASDIDPVYSKTATGKSHQTFTESPVYIKQQPLEFAGNGRSLVLKSFEAKGSPTKGSITPSVSVPDRDRDREKDKDKEDGAGARNETTMYANYGQGTDITELIDSSIYVDPHDKAQSSKAKEAERLKKLRDMKKTTVNFMEYRSTGVDPAEVPRTFIRGNKLTSTDRVGLKTPANVRLDPELLKQREALQVRIYICVCVCMRIYVCICLSICV